MPARTDGKPVRLLITICTPTTLPQYTHSQFIYQCGYIGSGYVMLGVSVLGLGLPGLCKCV